MNRGAIHVVMRRHSAVLLGVCGFAATGLRAADPLPGADDKWQLLHSPNFELFSHSGDAASRDLLRNLELLRAVFIERFGLVERRKQPVTVFSFHAEKIFRAYAPAAWGKKHEFTGFYHEGPERSIIVLGPAEDWESARRLIFHEYVHHLFRASEETPPVWFNEGVAELFASLVVNKKTIEFGRPIAGRVQELQGKTLMPLEQLFGIDHESTVFRQNQHTGLFYAQSWALLHYWHFGMSQLPPEKVAQFLREVRRPQPLPPSILRERFGEAFGMDYPEMVKRLREYVTHGKYRWSEQSLPLIAPPESYSATKLTRDEIRLRLAELALRVNRLADARLLLLHAATAVQPDPRALELLGADHLREGDGATAKQFWEKAIAAGSMNPAIYRELGLMESRMWFQHFDYYFRQPEPTTEHLRNLLNRSIEYCPDQTGGYEMLAWVEAAAVKPSPANVNRIQERFGKLREKHRTLLALALIRHRLGDDPTALQLLDQLEKFEPEQWVATGAAAVRARIDGRPIERAVRQQRHGPPPARIRPPVIDVKPSR